MNKRVIAVVLLLVVVSAVCYHPPWMTQEWCTKQVQEKPYGDFHGTQMSLFNLERFYVGDYVAFGREVGVSSISGVLGGWWEGWMDPFGNIYVEFVS